MEYLLQQWETNLRENAQWNVYKTPLKGKDGKISALQRGSAELETNRNISRGCLRFFHLALLPVFDSLYLI
jgi:hypothetical protein